MRAQPKISLLLVLVELPDGLISISQVSYFESSSALKSPRGQFEVFNRDVCFLKSQSVVGCYLDNLATKILELFTENLSLG
jgi:hypothetical protein